jgi:hypothetical protein
VNIRKEATKIIREHNRAVNIAAMNKHFTVDPGRKLTPEEIAAVQITPIERIATEPKGNHNVHFARRFER